MSSAQSIDDYYIRSEACENERMHEERYQDKMMQKIYEERYQNVIFDILKGYMLPGISRITCEYAFTVFDRNIIIQLIAELNRRGGYYPPSTGIKLCRSGYCMFPYGNDKCLIAIDTTDAQKLIYTLVSDTPWPIYLYSKNMIDDLWDVIYMYMNGSDVITTF